MDFYDPIMTWVREMESPVEMVTFNFHLDYFNSSSNKYILRLIQEIGNHSNVSVNWYYDEIDEAMRDAGEDYRENVAVPFNMCPVED